MKTEGTFIMPKGFENLLENHEIVKVNGTTLLESCHDGTSEVSGKAYTAQHEILYVLSGVCELVIRKNKVTITQGQSILMPKNTILRYRKTGKPYRSLLFFFEDDFIMDFLQSHDIGREVERTAPDFQVFEPDALLEASFQSMLPYIKNAKNTSKALFKVKTFEILLNLCQQTNTLPSILLEIAKPDRIALRPFMEHMYLNRMGLADFARLSGRSLSTFKREFQSVFRQTPYRWIKQRRLNHARELMEFQAKKPMEVFLEVGFEDYSHFSKSFKSYFGYLPSKLVRNAS